MRKGKCVLRRPFASPLCKSLTTMSLFGCFAHEPHRIAFYLYDLASDFHTQWNRGNDASRLRFVIQDDPQMTVARLALVQGVVTVLASGLGLLGVEAPDEMR